MQYIVYVSNRITDPESFGEQYTYVQTDTDLQSLVDDLNLKDKDITGAFVLINNGDYDEIWVTYSNAPYLVSAPYHKVIRYYRNSPGD